MTALVFCDTETTGLSLFDDIWEFAAVRREDDGTESEHHFFVRHSRSKAAKLPDRFRTDLQRRYDRDRALTRAAAAKAMHAVTQGRPHIVGAVPNFDTERIAALMRQYGYDPDWHYHLIDVENLAVGWLWGRFGWMSDDVKDKIRDGTTRPWRSDDLSRMCGVEPPNESERHTALGDVRWVMRWYDKLMDVEAMKDAA